MTKAEIIDQHDVVPMAAKKVWNVLRVLHFMLRKEMSRRKIMSDLNLMMKRGKIAGKAISSLMAFHGHHQQQQHTACPNDSRGPDAEAEYEFSCSNTPAIGTYNCPRKYLNDRFFSSLHGNGHFHGLFRCAHLPRTNEDDVDSFGFGIAYAARVRQLRITDSPYPLKDEGDGGKVDKAAEEFIQKFYSALQRQKSG